MVNKQPKEQASFEEIGRIKVSEKTDVVLSLVTAPADETTPEPHITGIHINNFIRTPKFTGFAGGGVFIPKEHLSEFAKILMS